VLQAVERLPPHSVEAEEAVLGAVLVDSSAMDACLLARLEPADFFRDQNRWVYDAMWSCLEEGIPPTVTTVIHVLGRTGKLDEVGGEPFVAKLWGATLTAIGVEAHIKVVQDCAKRRRVIQEAGWLAQRAYEKGPAADVIRLGLEGLGKLLSERDAGMTDLGFVDDDEDQSGANWYIPVLDKVTRGMSPGQMTILAGQSGLGKSMVAAHIVRACAEQGGRVAVFSLEMGEKEYKRRLVTALSGVERRQSKWEQEHRPYSPADLANIETARGIVQGWGIYCKDKPGVTLQEVAASVRTMNAEKHVDLVVVDYLQLMGGQDSDNAAQSLKNITGGLKSLAMEIGCHVLAVSQMNRAGLGEMRSKESKKESCIITGEDYSIPLKEFLMGGAIENDADLCVMLANHAKCPEKHIEVCVVKNRNGQDGHGMVFSQFNLCRIGIADDKMCYDVAQGDLAMAHALRIDQGLWHGDN